MVQLHSKGKILKFLQTKKRIYLAIGVIISAVLTISFKIPFNSFSSILSL